MANKRITLPPTDPRRHNDPRWLAVFELVCSLVDFQDEAEDVTDDIFAALADPHA